MSTHREGSHAASSDACVGEGAPAPSPRTLSRVIVSKGVEHTLLYDECDREIGEQPWHIVKVSAKALYAALSRPTRYLHREILGLAAGDPRECDHVDGNGLDNRRANLRIATRAEQQCNRDKPDCSLRRFKGVSVSGKRFVASITSNYKLIYLGTFDTEEEAALAYNLAALRLHGDFARLNVIPAPAGARRA